MRVQRGSTGTALFCPNLALDGVGGWCDTLAALSRGRAPVLIGGGWIGPRAGLDGFW